MICGSTVPTMFIDIIDTAVSEKVIVSKNTFYGDPSMENIPDICKPPL